MDRTRFVAAVVTGAFAALALSAAAGADQRLPCARATLIERKPPVGPAQYQAGRMRFSNGAALRLSGTPDELGRVRAMRVGDPVALCYGPPATYADAGPARTLTVLDLRNGMYYGSLVGTWKAR